jgi:steroid 5-alpha reductase family enzyme
MWATRLGSFLYARILKDGKDERFDAIKSVWLSFLGAWTLQGTWVVLIQLPVVLLNSINDSRPQIGSLDYLAMICWIVGFLFEAAADTEKMAFRSVPENKGKYLTTGLWALSRHPNYFGGDDQLDTF